MMPGQCDSQNCEVNISKEGENPNGLDVVCPILDRTSKQVALALHLHERYELSDAAGVKEVTTQARYVCGERKYQREAGFRDSMSV